MDASNIPGSEGTALSRHAGGSERGRGFYGTAELGKEPLRGKTGTKQSKTEAGKMKKRIVFLGWGSGRTAQEFLPLEVREVPFLPGWNSTWRAGLSPFPGFLLRDLSVHGVQIHGKAAPPGGKEIPGAPHNQGIRKTSIGNPEVSLPTE